MPHVTASLRLALLSSLAIVALHGAETQPAWLPPGLPPLPESGPALCPRDFLTPEQGAALLDATLKQFPDAAAWQTYADLVRKKIQETAGLAPWPARRSLNAVVSDRRDHDGYSVENVRLETAPGVYACGTLYRPLHATKPSPIVLTTHGHTGGVKEEKDWANHGRFYRSVQFRAATLARLGAVVLAVDMFGYGDSLVQFGPDAHRTPLSMGWHLWNNRCALDFLESLDDVDRSRIAVTGESGGGTQTFLLAALDPRVTVSAPVVMVSSYFFGGCPCESGLPVHRSKEYFASNAVMAALTAPRPQLLVSDGKDWTQHTPQTEFPFLQKVYGYFSAQEKVQNVHLPTEGHDYGPSKRAAVVAFLVEQLGLNPDPAARDESHVTLEAPEVLRVFKSEAALPAGAKRTPVEVRQALSQ